MMPLLPAPWDFQTLQNFARQFKPITCHAGQVVVSGSHGGTSAAGFVLAQERPPLACFFNDAGVGKEGAGVAGLALLQPRGTVAATYSHDSARIGDAADGAASGIITHLNAAATAAGLAEGMRVGASAS